MTHAEHAREVWSMLTAPTPCPPRFGLDMLMERAECDRGEAINLLRVAAFDTLKVDFGRDTAWTITPEKAMLYFNEGSYQSCGYQIDRMVRVETEFDPFDPPDDQSFAWLAWCNLVNEAVAIMRELESIP